jgi:hypothetical protein
LSRHDCNSLRLDLIMFFHLLSKGLFTNQLLNFAFLNNAAAGGSSHLNLADYPLPQARAGQFSSDAKTPGAVSAPAQTRRGIWNFKRVRRQPTWRLASGNCPGDFQNPTIFLGLRAIKALPPTGAIALSSSPARTKPGEVSLGLRLPGWRGPALLPAFMSRRQFAAGLAGAGQVLRTNRKTKAAWRSSTAWTKWRRNGALRPSPPCKALPGYYCRCPAPATCRAGRRPRAGQNVRFTPPKNAVYAI